MTIAVEQRKHMNINIEIESEIINAPQLLSELIHGTYMSSVFSLFM